MLTKEKRIFFIGEISYAEKKVAMRTKEPIELKSENLKPELIRAIAVGHDHLLVMGADNQIFAFGSN